MSQSASSYFVPQPSHWPIFGSAALLLTMLFGWFAKVITESEGGAYGKNVDKSFRWSMGWFIFSEVMFFSAFFGALYWARNHSVPALGSLDNALLWPNFKALWPSVAAGATAAPAGTVEPYQTMGPWPIPTINTALLLTSGVTLTVAHHALLASHRAKAILW